jgi:hypothetical protein
VGKKDTRIHRIRCTVVADGGDAAHARMRRTTCNILFPRRSLFAADEKVKQLLMVNIHMHSQTHRLNST